MPRAGLQYADVYEWRETARWHGMAWDDFCDLDGDDQSALIAHFQTSRQIEAVLAKDLEARKRRAQAAATRRQRR